MKRLLPLRNRPWLPRLVVPALAGLLVAPALRGQTCDVPPSAAPDQFDVVRGVPTLLDVLANDRDPDGHELSVRVPLGSMPLGTLEDHGDGSFTYTTTASVGTTDSFVYRLSDGTLERQATVTIRVREPLPGPTLAISFVPTQGAGRMELEASDSLPVGFDYYFDPNLGRFESRPGGHCTPVTDNPTYVKLRKIGGGNLRGCTLAATWDPGPIDCPAGAVADLNTGLAIIVNTNDFETELNTCRDAYPLESRVRFGEEAVLTIILLTEDNKTHVREFRLTKSSQVHYIPPVADTYVSTLEGAANFGSAPELRIEGGTHLSYLRFQPSGLIGAVGSASLRLQASSPVTSAVLRHYPQAATWNEHQLTYDNHFQQIAVGVSSWLDQLDGWVTGQERRFDLGPTVTGSGSYTFGIETLAGEPAGAFHSKEGAPPPTMVVTTQDTLTPTLISDFTIQCVELRCYVDGSSSVGHRGRGVGGWLWDFGDGSPLRERFEPTTSHAYSNPGFYPVTLTVFDEFDVNQQHSSMQQVLVVESLAADFDVTCTDFQCQFDGAASAGEITSYGWDFGDGATQSTAGPLVSHTYTEPGTCIVTLTVRNAESEAALSQPVTVSEELAASFVHACSELGCSFDASASAGDVGLYVWDFGDGNLVQTAGTVASHTYAASGTYSVALTVTDAYDPDATQLTQRSVLVSQTPVADFTVSCLDRTCTFDASGSSGTQNAYEWDFGDGSRESSSQPTAVHTYSTEGDYLVTLTVGVGTETDQAQAALDVRDVVALVLLFLD